VASPFVQVLATLAAQPAAIRAAQGLEGGCQQHLFVQYWLQFKVSVLPDVVRFVCGGSGEEGKHLFKTDAKRLVERFQASDTFGCGFGLDAALGHDTSVCTGKLDRSAHKANRQVAFQGTRSFLDGKSYLSADGRFQERGNIVAHH
jgi:hypothetical protein